MSVYEDFKVVLENPNSSWTLLYNMIKPGSKILDVGCSSGYFAETLIKENKCIVDGLEIDKKDAERAQKVCRKVVVGNAEEINFEDVFKDKYDYIIFADVFEHLINPSKVLKNVSKVLTTNGQVLFSIPNMANGAVRLQLLQGNFDYENEGLLDRTHIHFYTKKAVIDMVNKAGMRLHVLDSTTFDVPKNIIDKSLKITGLKANEEFYKYIASGESLIYQFIGSIKKAEKTKKIDNIGHDKTIVVKPKLSYQKEIESVQADSRDLFERLKNEEKKAEELLQKINALEIEKSELQHELNTFHKIPGLKKTIKIARKTKRKLKK